MTEKVDIFKDDRLDEKNTFKGFVNNFLPIVSNVDDVPMMLFFRGMHKGESGMMQIFVKDSTPDARDEIMPILRDGCVDKFYTMCTSMISFEDKKELSLWFATVTQYRMAIRYYIRDENNRWKHQMDEEVIGENCDETPFLMSLLNY